MDQTLHAHVRLDIASDLVLVDVRGSLTQESRPSLREIIRRIRGMGITSRIRVDLGHAAFVESAALAGLRHDLNAVAGLTSAGGGLPPDNGVSLELNARTGDAVVVLETLDLSAGLGLSSAGRPGRGPLARYSDDELFAASDSVFGMLDTPAITRPELLASFDEISLELGRREGGTGTKRA